MLVTDKSCTVEVMRDLVEMFGTDTNRIVLSFGAARNISEEPNDLDVYTDPETFGRMKEFVYSSDVDLYEKTHDGVKILPPTLGFPESESIELYSTVWDKKVSLHPTIDDRYLNEDSVMVTDAGWYMVNAQQLALDYIDLIDSSLNGSKRIEQVSEIIKIIGTRFLFEVKNIKYLTIWSQIAPYSFEKFSELPERQTIQLHLDENDCVRIYSPKYFPPVMLSKTRNTATLLCDLGDFIEIISTKSTNKVDSKVEVITVYEVIKGTSGAVVRELKGDFDSSDFGGQHIYDCDDMYSLEELISRRISNLAGVPPLKPHGTSFFEFVKNQPTAFFDLKNGHKNVEELLYEIAPTMFSEITKRPYKIVIGSVAEVQLALPNNCNIMLQLPRTFESFKELDASNEYRQMFISVTNEDLSMTFIFFQPDWWRQDERMRKAFEVALVGIESQRANILLNMLMTKRMHYLPLQAHTLA